MYRLGFIAKHLSNPSIGSGRSIYRTNKHTKKKVYWRLRRVQCRVEWIRMKRKTDTNKNPLYIMTFFFLFWSITLQIKCAKLSTGYTYCRNVFLAFMMRSIFCYSPLSPELPSVYAMSCMYASICCLRHHQKLQTNPPILTHPPPPQPFSVRVSFFIYWTTRVYALSSTYIYSFWTDNRIFCIINVLFVLRTICTYFVLRTRRLTHAHIDTALSAFWLHIFDRDAYRSYRT